MTIRINDPDKQAFEQEHEDLVRRLAPECMVLLRNDGTLPLTNMQSVALYGNGARQTIKGGTGSGDVNVRHFVTVEEGLEKAGITVTTKDWLDAYDQVISAAKKDFYQKLRQEAKATGQNPILATMGKMVVEPNYQIPLHKGTDADTAVYVLARNSGEGSDRRPVPGDIKLTETELRDIVELNKTYQHFALILNVGGLIDLTGLEEIKTVLLLGQLGSATGDACADVLTGKAYPSGKLTMTWAPIEDYPSTEGFGDPNNTNYREGIFVGYRYFDSTNTTPIYPFGFGLGYTTFKVSPGTVEVDGETITVNATVTNTGSAAGKDVVEVYYSAPQPDRSLPKPYQALAGFVKTQELQGGQSQVVSLTFNLSSLASYDQKSSAYLLEAGDYALRVGDSSRSTHIAGIVRLSDDVVTQQLHAVGGESGFTDFVPSGPAYSYPEEAHEIATATVVEIDAGSIPTTAVSYSDQPAEITRTEPFSWKDVASGQRSLDEFVGTLSDEDLTYLCVGAYKDSDDLMEVIGDASTTLAGAAGETTHQIEGQDLPVLTMADGPAGLRLSQRYTLDGGKPQPLETSMGADMLSMYSDEELAAMKSRATDSARARTVYYQYCTAIPIGTELAQSWDDDLVQQCGDLVGDEMELFGANLWLAPAMNIQRSPLCGRDFEYYSEDPLIAGRIAAAITRGVSRHQGCATTIKHFAANNQETNRYFQNNNISERALREIYLKGFEICVKTSHPRTVMTSYNLINGEHACNRYDLVTEILRDEWGFDGLVMTDWLVTGGMGPSGDQWPAASAAGCVKAGNDLTMPGIPSDKKDIMNALSNPEHQYSLTRATLQQSARRVLAMILELTGAENQD